MRYNRFTMIVGIDEAGRGPVVGPLVVCGVAFENDEKLIANKIRDSKMISPRKRIEFAKKIKEWAICYEIITIPAIDIDDMRRVMSLNEIEVNIFSKIIEKIHPDICYIDAADVNEKRFGFDISSRLSWNLQIISKHKADRLYPIVGAASILAKTTRDYEIQKITKNLQKKLKEPLGSGYPADPITIDFLKHWIKIYGELPPYTRRSWKTSQTLLRNYQTKKLDDF